MARAAAPPNFIVFLTRFGISLGSVSKFAAAEFTVQALQQFRVSSLSTVSLHFADHISIQQIGYIQGPFSPPFSCRFADALGRSGLPAAPRSA